MHDTSGMTRDDLLARVRVERPCTQPLAPLPGTTARLHCAACQRDVVDLSRMRRAEANRFLASEEGRNACVSFLSAADGSPRSLDDGLEPAGRKGVAAALMLSLAACGKGPPDVSDPLTVSPVTKLDPSLAELELPPCDTPQRLEQQARESLAQREKALAGAEPGGRTRGQMRIVVRGR